MIQDEAFTKELRRVASPIGRQFGRSEMINHQVRKYNHMTVYGIKNCNTVKSALEWLKNNKVEFEFHDYKSKGIAESKLKDWSKQVGWESLVNKRGTTWRQLDEAVQKKVTSEAAAINLMKDKTSVIKRPLIERDGKVIALGFDEEAYKKVF